jgi:hypothetical protein
MTIPKQALMYGCGGLFFLLWMSVSLSRGEIQMRRTVIYRSSDPFQFYALIFFYALLATIFIGAGIFVFLHPHFSLFPAADGADD